MARHSKWHKVRQFKGAIDAKRAASFTKLAREITVSAKEKGADPETNARLRVAIQKAREASMPKDNIERAIQRGAGGGAEGELETLTYEAYAPGGTALIVECVTDNRNRTANEVKHLISKNGATFAASGAVTYLFDRIGLVRVKGAFPSDKRDAIELALIDAGATNIETDEEGTDLWCTPNDLGTLSHAVTAIGLEIEEAAFSWMPKTRVETNEENGLLVAELIELLEAEDDVSRVFSNLA